MHENHICTSDDSASERVKCFCAVNIYLSGTGTCNVIFTKSDLKDFKIATVNYYYYNDYPMKIILIFLISQKTIVYQVFSF